MRERYRVIARVQKAHGKKGEVVTVPVHGLPPVVRDGLTVAVVPPPLRGSRWHVVERCVADAREGTLVALSGVDTIGRAEELVGRYLLAPASELPADLARHDAEALIGRVVRCADGSEGKISEVLRGPANDVWVVRGEHGELLVPVVDEVVGEVAEAGPIDVELPAGLAWERGLA